MAIEDLVSHSKLGSGSSQHGSVDLANVSEMV